MSANRKTQSTASTSRVQSRMYKFLKEAKTELDPATYASLVDTLVKYQAGKGCEEGRA